jgi:hypothetical protein
MAAVGTKPWFYSQKLGFFALKLKIQCIDRKKMGFPHPCFDVIVALF